MWSCGRWPLLPRKPSVFSPYPYIRNSFNAQTWYLLILQGKQINRVALAALVSISRFFRKKSIYVLLPVLYFTCTRLATFLNPELSCYVPALRSVANTNKPEMLLNTQSTNTRVFCVSAKYKNKCIV